MEKLKSIWMDGKLVDWDDAKIHVLTHALHYGSAAFEGIRSYETSNGGAAVFRLDEHIRRLFNSCKVLGLPVPHDFETLCAASVETLKDNGLKAGYIRPLVYLGEGGMGVLSKDNVVRVFIAVWKWGTYLGEDALTKGIRAKVSSFNRYRANTAMPQAKITGYYVTGGLAKREARDLGYDEAIMLDTDGFVAEGSGENIFIVRDGVLKTTPLTVILPGITRDTIIKIAGDAKLTVREERFVREELYTADEAFFTGTAAEVTPIREVDGRPIGTGKPGPITKQLQTTYFDIVKGRNARYEEWLTRFDLPKGAAGASKAAKPARVKA